MIINDPLTLDPNTLVHTQRQRRAIPIIKYPRARQFFLHTVLVEYLGERRTTTRATWLRAHPEELIEFEGRLVTFEHFDFLFKKKAEDDAAEEIRQA
ncbi:hypothetical protein AC579_724 [Pseudocercospora musae]|uniref:Uncharacterized protein n=1 Tax=Pseudocercospora musae TaxID=113226 RepID=A0A139I9G9_9PEZI|nr:hypothetical protein AC579_724 [Pseudocercospora musae]